MEEADIVAQRSLMRWNRKTKRRDREHAELKRRQESSDRRKKQRISKLRRRQESYDRRKRQRVHVHCTLYSISSAKLRRRQESSDRRKRQRVYLVQS